MAIDTSNYGPDSWENKSKPKTYEQTISDISSLNESFLNARNAGYIQPNNQRLTLFSELSEYEEKDRFSYVDPVTYKRGKYSDSSDYFKVNLMGTGYLRLSFTDEKTSIGNVDKDVDFSDKTADEIYEEYKKNIDEYKKQFDPKGIHVEIYYYSAATRKSTIVADNTAKTGDDLRTNFEDMMTGNYKVTSKNKGYMYIKVSRQSSVAENDKVMYMMQAQLKTAKPSSEKEAFVTDTTGKTYDYKKDLVTMETSITAEEAEEEGVTSTTTSSYKFASSSAQLSYMSMCTASSILSSSTYSPLGSSGVSNPLFSNFTTVANARLTKTSNILSKYATTASMETTASKATGISNIMSSSISLNTELNTKKDEDGNKSQVDKFKSNANLLFSGLKSSDL